VKQLSRRRGCGGGGQTDNSITAASFACSDSSPPQPLVVVFS